MYLLRCYTKKSRKNQYLRVTQSPDHLTWSQSHELGFCFILQVWAGCRINRGCGGTRRITRVWSSYSTRGWKAEGYRRVGSAKTMEMEVPNYLCTEKKLGAPGCEWAWMMQTIVVRSAPAVRARQRTVKRFRVMNKLTLMQVESRSPWNLNI